jgi:alcohol dehydrogenase class IV
MTPPKIPTPQKLFTDCHAIGGLLPDMNAGQIFLVADSIGYEASGASVVLEPILQGRLAGRVDVNEPNPQWPGVLDCVGAIREAKPGAVLAVGGGTAMDVAKLANWLAAQSAEPEAILESPPEQPAPAPPVIAIPTTAGSGSEATQFAVVYREGEKHSVAHASLRPTATIVDPALTANLPPDLSAHSGLDALCQAIESIWSIHATEDSLAPAQAALALTWQHLEAAVHQPTPAARSAMAWGAHLAGQAINLTQTTAPHALSYTLTSAFGIPHGAAVALTLGPMLVFNANLNKDDCADPRGPEAVRARLALICETLGAANPAEACAVFQKKVESVNCPVTLSAAGLTSEGEVDQICARVNLQRLANNPRRLTAGDIQELLVGIGD